MKIHSALFLSLAVAAGATHAQADHPTSVTTLITTPFVIEGLTSDRSGNLYAPGRAPTAADACPIYRVNIDNPVLATVGLIPASTPACSPSGLAFGPDAMLYVTATDRIMRLTPSDASPTPVATVFATGVPGTNGLAFDEDGNLWTGDGTTGLGRVWRITPQGAVSEMFRVQPMANEVNLVAGVGGVGRDVRTLPPGTITVTATSRNAANTAGSQPLVANGVAFDQRGTLYIADTARGAIWRVRFNSDGTVRSRTGCDTTFTANTLCMENVWFQHPWLEGLDGIALDVGGNIWGVANERNAITWVHAGTRQIVEVFRNPVDSSTQLRNLGPLETPASPVVVGHKFCTSNSDGNRRDNSPSNVGEIGGSGQPRGKISCLDQRVIIPGMDLPVR